MKINNFISKIRKMVNKNVFPLVSILVLLISVSIFTYTGLIRIEAQSRESMIDSMETVLATTHDEILVWFSQQQVLIQDNSRNPELVEVALKLLDLQHTQEMLLADPLQSETRSILQPVLDQYGFDGFFIISTDHINLASRRDENVGWINLIAQERPDLFVRVIQGETLLIPPIISDVPLINEFGDLEPSLPTMFMASPIYSPSGEVIAILTFRIDPEKDFTRIAQIGRIGDTGETYAFSKNGLLISESRFDYHLRAVGLIGANENGILRIRISDPGGNLVDGYEPEIPREEQPLTVMALSATAGNSDLNSSGYRDYRGVRVLGVWLWDSQLGIGIATEIDEEEALLAYVGTRNILFTVIGFTLILSFGLLTALYLVSRKADREKLEAFENLERRVDERTKELALMNEELEKEIEERKKVEEKLIEAQNKLETAYELLKNQSTTDALTGIANRRKFDESLRKEWQRSMRSGFLISLLLFDIDFFKDYNDNYGHLAGDDVMRKIGSVFNDLIYIRRPGDLAARYGGEEFAILISGGDIEYAKFVAEETLKAVQVLEIEHKYSKVENRNIITLSGGIAIIKAEKDIEASKLIQNADMALYKAKKCGRNRIEIYEDKLD